MASPRFPGVGTQSRTADVRLRERGLGLQEDALDRQTAQQLLSFLSSTGLGVGELLDRGSAREEGRAERGREREFRTGERVAGEEFRAREAALGRVSREAAAGAQREFVTTEREAGQEFATGEAEIGAGRLEERDERLAKQAADAATVRFKREAELELARTGRVPIEAFERGLREAVAGVAADIAQNPAISDEEAALTVQRTIELYVNSNRQVAEQTQIGRDVFAKRERAAEVQARRTARGPASQARAEFFERERPAMELEEREARRRENVRFEQEDINAQFRAGEITAEEARERFQVLSPGPLEMLFGDPSTQRERELRMLEILNRPTRPAAPAGPTLAPPTPRSILPSAGRRRGL